MFARFFTTDRAPLDVRVARVVVPPWPLAAYFLIRMPQVADGVMVPWPEAVTVTLLVVVLVPLWLYWVADLVSWRRERRTAEPGELELTTDLSAHGFFAGDLAALVDAEAHGRAVPPKHRATNYFVQAAASGSWLQGEHEKLMAAGATTLDGETYTFPAMGPDYPDQLGDLWEMRARRAEQPTEPLLLTHEFTPASGIRMDAAFADAGVIMSWDPAADGQQVVARTPDGRVYPVGRVDVVKPSPTGRHRKREQAHPIPPIADVPNAEAYAFLNRSRELGY